MYCPNCSQPIPEGALFCGECGTAIAAAAPAASATPVEPAAPVYTPPAPINVSVNNVTESHIPSQYNPLTAWQYFGLQLLFAIPVVGFVFLIVFSCNSSNLNRRNFARSYWCGLIISAAIAVAVIVIAVIIALITGASIASMVDF